jgi:hypothetical protein
MDPSTDRAANSTTSETEAAELLARLHAAQNDFYAGGGDAALRAVLSPDISWHITDSRSRPGRAAPDPRP